MTTSDLWRSWPPRPTSRGLTVHLLNQHLRAASLWHSNISLTQALHIITLATTPSRLLSLSIVTTILNMGPSHSIVLDKMFLGVDMQIRCRLSTWESSMHHYLSNESATHPSWNSYRCHLNMIFLSDITSMDRRSINTDMIWGGGPVLQSKLQFPPEHPTARDWLMWTEICIKATGSGLSLSSPLGEWLKSPHFTWPWRYSLCLSEDDEKRQQDCPS